MDDEDEALYALSQTTRADCCLALRRDMERMARTWPPTRAFRQLRWLAMTSLARHGDEALAAPVYREILAVSALLRFIELLSRARTS